MTATTTAIDKPPTKAARDKEAAEMLERVVIGGDLAKLTPHDRIVYYDRLCGSLGLNPLTQPFRYLYLSNKLTLYATKDCTEQLRMLHDVSIARLESRRDEDVYLVTVYGSSKGRDDVATGAVAIGNLRGEALANAIMKAETKAKRRFTLSICGLGVIDETEVGDVSIGGTVDVDPTTGEIINPPRDPLASVEQGPEAGAPDPRKEELIGRIVAGFDTLKISAHDQVELWAQFCGLAAFQSSDAYLDDLQALYAHLSARYKESTKKP